MMKSRYNNCLPLTLGLLALALVSAEAQPPKQRGNTPKARTSRAGTVASPVRAHPLKQADPIPPTTDVLVFLVAGTDAQAFAKSYGLTVWRQLKSDVDAYVFRARTPQQASEALRRIGPTAFQSMMPVRHPQAAADGRVRYAILDEILPRDYHAFTPNDILFNGNIFQDLYAGQWHLVNQFAFGLDINVWPAWQRDVTGSGVIIGIIDDGIQIGHPDLSPNVSLEDCWDYAGNDADPNPPDNSEKHGTAVAGVSAARGGNSIGVTGVAPYAKIAGLRLGANLFNTIDSTLYHSNSANTRVKVKNHSYGNTRPFLSNTGERDAVRVSTAVGTIHVYSAGNYRGTTIADSTKMMVQNDPDVICVAAMDGNGVAASYSNYGSCIAVTAPSNGAALSGIATTDLVGDNGYNGMSVFGIPIYTDYTNQFGGTSAAAPIISGVMALAKQVQPNLTTRIAKHLLARTSRKIDSSHPEWVTNKAGINFNPNYGFGLINTDTFTALAPYYPSVTPLTTETIPTTAVNRAIPDGPTIFEPFVIDSTTPMEEIQVTINISHGNANHIAAGLISPAGTRARLCTASDVDVDAKGNANVPVNINWTFTSNAFWGENPSGFWYLQIQDRRTGVTGTWNSFAVTVRMGQLEERSYYVDKAFTGSEAGTPSNPFRSVTAALNAVPANESVRIYVKQGNYGSDKPRVTKKVQFLNWGNNGLSRIGKP